MADAATDEQVALRVLSRLVRDEYPQDLSLAEIARTWGGATDEEVAAIERTTAALAT